VLTIGASLRLLSLLVMIVLKSGSPGVQRHSATHTTEGAWRTGGNRSGGVAEDLVRSCTAPIQLMRSPENAIDLVRYSSGY
jgi:hypothetical protein